MNVEIKSFGEYQGKKYDEIFITNDQGTQISFSNLGARINRWGIEQEDGHYEQIILGHPDAQEVFTSGSYYGATIGRTAGRINQGRFTLNGKEIQLPRNNGENHLHGGFEGLDLEIFDYTIEENDQEVRVIFSLVDPDGHNEYPGTLTLQVVHTYNQQNEWTIEYTATTDQPTLFNPTNHVYFNLNGDNRQSIENHLVQLKASRYMSLETTTIPTGHLEAVEGTVFDLRQATRLGDRLTANEPQFDFTKGYDHPFVIDEGAEVSAIIDLPERQRRIEMTTDEVAVVVYAHGYPVNVDTVWNQPLKQFAGITLETQNLPNAIHNPHFGDTVLSPGETYQSKTTYRLLTNK